MDREKAIQVLKRCEAESHCNHYKQHYCCIGCGQREALDLAIEALGDAESATTTDCISRQQAIDEVKNICNTPCNEYFVKAIESLPPVTPTERIGEWIEDEEQHHVERTYHCSECGFGARGECEKTRWCGGCGAKMKGGTENE